MQHFSEVHLQLETGCQNVSALPFIDEFLLCFSAAFVSQARVPVIKPLPLCFNSMFTSDEIIHNAPADCSSRKHLQPPFLCQIHISCLLTRSLA